MPYSVSNHRLRCGHGQPCSDCPPEGQCHQFIVSRKYPAVRTVLLVKCTVDGEMRTIAFDGIVLLQLEYVEYGI